MSKRKYSKIYAGERQGVQAASKTVSGGFDAYDLCQINDGQLECSSCLLGSVIGWFDYYAI